MLPLASLPAQMRGDSTYKIVTARKWKEKCAAQKDVWNHFPFQRGNLYREHCEKKSDEILREG